MREPGSLTPARAEILTQLYLNTYAHVLGFRGHLRVYETARADEGLDLVAEVARGRVTGVGVGGMGLGDFVAYLRLFYREMDAGEVLAKLKEY